MTARRLSPILAKALAMSALAGIDLPDPPVLPPRRRREDDPPREPPPDPSPIRGERAHSVIVDEMQDPAWREPPVPSAPPGPYHDHLDRCAQCRNNPFGLCAVGARALEAEALKVTTGPTPFRADPLWDAFNALPIEEGPMTERRAAALARAEGEIARGEYVVVNMRVIDAEAKRARKRAARLARKVAR